MKFVRLLVISLLTLCLLPAKAEDLSAEKRGAIEHLLEMTGSLAIGKQMAVAMSAQIAQMVRSKRQDVPQRVMDSFPEDVAAVLDANMSSLAETLIPIYDKHFSLEEIRGLEAFYASDLGKKTVKVLPVLMSEAMSAGQIWGQQVLAPQLNARIRERLKRQGYPI